MECPICVSSITKSNRIIMCGYCDFNSCIKCNKEFFKTQTHARCMNTDCKKEFTRNYLITNFTKTYVNTEYKNHLKTLYFQTEQSKLPETICKIAAKKTHKTRQKEIKHIYTAITDPELNEQLEFYIMLYNLYKYCYRHEHYIYIQNEPKTIVEIDTYFNQMSLSKKQYVPKYVGRCPSDQCKGFINSKYICELCYSHICDKCNILITDMDSTHTCDESLVSTIQLIKKDTKPCPTCHVSIYKIDGCDQMWCVECHTAFSWTTGEIEQKIHNPHYYEYLRNSNQHEKLLRLHNNNNVECNPNEEEYDFLDNFGMNISMLLRHLSIYTTHFVDIKQVYDIYIGINRTLVHIEEVEIPHNFYLNTSRELDRLRINYALNKLTDILYKNQVHQIYKRNAYNEEITQLLQTFIIIIKDLLKIHISRFALEKTTLTVDTINQEMRNDFIKVYCWLDTKLEETSKVFNYVTLCLAHDIYIPGCSIKSKSRVDSLHIGSSGFDIIYI